MTPKESEARTSEAREPYGYFMFAIIPRKCRDGKFRCGWLEWFNDNTFIKARL